MDYTKLIAELEDVREYINNRITDAQAVARAHDNSDQVNDGLYSLADAAKDIIMMAGYYSYQVDND